jgi:vancomycin resistance protein YoaR
MASYSTRFASSGRDSDRARNVRLAASLLDDVLEPGDEMSFNRNVGVRERWRGFVDAPTIFAGEVVPDVGGGVCQVSSTLYSAALLAGLEVVDRTPHSRASSYVPAGMDATVALPEGCDLDGASCASTDLVLRNPWGFPVGVRTFISEVRPGLSELRVEVWGHDPVHRPVLRRTSSPGKESVRRSRPAFVRNPKRTQSGKPGQTVRTTVDYGGVMLLEIRSAYRPVDEVWEVPRGFSGPEPWCGSHPDDPSCTQ